MGADVKIRVAAGAAPAISLKLDEKMSRWTQRCRKWPTLALNSARSAQIEGVESRARNLVLAARHHLGHIEPYGDVAEWLKAAVC
jgi:hypothetical protein